MKISEIKTLSILSGLLLLIFFYSSCKKTLNITSKTSYEIDNVFTSLSRTERVVMGVYPEFKGTAFMTYFTPDNDETYSTNRSGERYGLAKYDFGPANNQMHGPFRQFYTAVERSNEAIYGIIAERDTLKGSQEEKESFKALYGEALTLRAWAYFNLIRFWGDVPFLKEPSRAGDNFNLPRTSRDTIYDFILRDLRLAAKYVPWSSEVSYHDRITKAAVYGFMARIALHAAGYSLRWNLKTGSNVGMRRRDDKNRIHELYKIARNACKEVIDQGENHLLENYVDVFKHMHNHVYDSETIFQIGNYGLNANNGVGYYIGLSISKNDGTYLAAGPQVRVMPTFYLGFDSLDKRRDVTCGNYHISGNPPTFDLVTLSNMTCGKWRKCWQDNQGPSNGQTNINWSIIRYSDILLMYAEATNELLGPTAEAKKALSAVRYRAFPESAYQSEVQDYVDDLSDKDSFRNAIIDERSWELGCESNLRRTDLIRWNRLAKTINKTKNMMDEVWHGINPYTSKKIPVYRVYKSKSYIGNEPIAVPFIASDSKDNVPVGDSAFTFVVLSSLRSQAHNFATHFEENKKELIPFPQTLMDADSKITQLPGY